MAFKCKAILWNSEKLQHSGSVTQRMFIVTIHNHNSPCLIWQLWIFVKGVCCSCGWSVRQRETKNERCKKLSLVYHLPCEPLPDSNNFYAWQKQYRSLPRELSFPSIVMKRTDILLLEKSKPQICKSSVVSSSRSQSNMDSIFLLYYLLLGDMCTLLSFMSQKHKTS